MAEQKKKDVEEKDKKPEAKAETEPLRLAQPAQPMPAQQNVRLLVVETNGARANVKICTMQPQEGLNIVSDLKVMFENMANASSPLPSQLAQTPAPAQA